MYPGASDGKETMEFTLFGRSIFGLSKGKIQYDTHYQGEERNTTLTFDQTMRLASYRSALDLIVRSLVHIQIRAVGVDGEILDLPESRRLARRRPNPFQTRSTFLTQVIEQYLTNGNAFIYVDGQMMICLDSRKENVQISRNAAGYPVYSITEGNLYLPNSSDFQLDASNIIHIQKNASRGTRGIGALTELGPTLKLLKIAEDQMAVLLSENNNQYLYKPFKIAPDKDQSKLDTLIETVKKPGRKVLVINKEDELTQMPHLGSVDATLLANMDSLKSDIAAYFGMPADFLNVGQGSKYNNLRQSSSSFASSTLEPLARAIAESFSDFFKLREGVNFEFDLNEFIKGDVETHNRTVLMQVEKGIITQNEARALLGKAILPDPAYDRLIVTAPTLTISNPPTGGDDGSTADRAPEESETE